MVGAIHEWFRLPSRLVAGRLSEVAMGSGMPVGLIANMTDIEVLMRWWTNLLIQCLIVCMASTPVPPQPNLNHCARM